MLYDTDKSMGLDGMHSPSTEGAVWYHCKPASIIFKMLWWLARFLHNVRKHAIPIFISSKKEDSGNWTLSVPPWLWGMWWRKYLKIISRQLRQCLGVVSTNSQQRKSCLTYLTAFYEEHLTGWGETNGQGPRQSDLGGLLQQGGHRTRHTPKAHSSLCDCVKCL